MRIRRFPNKHRDRRFVAAASVFMFAAAFCGSATPLIGNDTAAPHGAHEVASAAESGASHAMRAAHSPNDHRDSAAARLHASDPAGEHCSRHDCCADGARTRTHRVSVPVHLAVLNLAAGIGRTQIAGSHQLDAARPCTADSGRSGPLLL